jgi:hypothetical protein
VQDERGLCQALEEPGADAKIIIALVLFFADGLLFIPIVLV